MPTEHPLAIVAGALLSLLGDVGDRVWIALILASYLWLVAGVYRLGRIAFTPLVGRDRRAAAADALRLRVPGRPRLHRHPVHGDRRVGGGAGGAQPAPRHARAACCSRWRACCAPRRGCWRPCTGAGCAWPASWRQRALVRRAGRGRRRCCGPPRTSRSPATRCSRCTTRAPRRRSSAASCRSRSCRPRCRSSSPNLVKLPVLVAAVLGLAIAILARPAPRGARRSRCSPPGSCTFVLIGIAGASAIERYLAVAGASRCSCSPRSRSAASRCSSPGGLRTRLGGGARSLVVIFGVVLDGLPPQPRALRRGAELPRRRPRRPRAGARDPAGQGRPALRAADAAQPQARAGLALDRRPALREGPRPRRPEAQAAAAQGRRRST